MYFFLSAPSLFWWLLNFSSFHPCNIYINIKGRRNHVNLASPYSRSLIDLTASPPRGYRAFYPLCKVPSRWVSLYFPTSKPAVCLMAYWLGQLMNRVPHRIGRQKRPIRRRFNRFFLLDLIFSIYCCVLIEERKRWAHPRWPAIFDGERSKVQRISKEQGLYNVEEKKKKNGFISRQYIDLWRI